MADFFFVEEYSTVKRDANGTAVQVTGAPIATHKIPLSTTSEITPVDFHPRTVWVQIQTDQDAYYKVGDDSITATPTDRLLYCRHMRPVTVDTGHFTRIAAVLRED